MHLNKDFPEQEAKISSLRRDDTCEVMDESAQIVQNLYDHGLDDQIRGILGLCL